MFFSYNVIEKPLSSETHQNQRDTMKLKGSENITTLTLTLEPLQRFLWIHTTITLLGFLLSFSSSLLNTVMSQNKNVSLERSAPQQPRPSNVYVGVGGSDSLCISPKRDHKSENYEDLQLEFNPLVFSSLEQYLPTHMLNLSREVKVQYMRNILLRYLPESERIRVGVTTILDFCTFNFCWLPLCLKNNGAMKGPDGCWSLGALNFVVSLIKISFWCCPWSIGSPFVCGTLLLFFLHSRLVWENFDGNWEK